LKFFYKDIKHRDIVTLRKSLAVLNNPSIYLIECPTFVVTYKKLKQLASQVTEKGTVC
jgi:hypothetical protein